MQAARRWWVIGVVTAVIIVLFAVLLINRKITTGNTLSQTGNQVAFMVWPVGEQGNLYVLDIDSGETFQLTQGDDTFSANWSPDGERMAVIYGETKTLYILDVNTGEARKINTTETGISQVVWSPDGMQLAYSAEDAIYIINRDGSGERELVRYFGGGFDWSPDGERILYIGVDDPDDNSSDRSVFVIHANGNNPQRVTLLEGVEKAPKWSPDGDHILFKLETAHDQWGGVLEEMLYVASANGSEIWEVDSLARNTPVSWSSEGKQVLYENVDARICRYHLVTGEKECGFPGFYPVWNPHGELIAYIDFEGRLCVSDRLAAGGCVDLPAEGTVYTVGWRP